MNWLSGEIKDDTTRYPTTAATTDGWSQEWALSTKEPTAWKWASRVMFLTYVLSSALWTVNFVLGQNGNVWHKLFYRFSQAFSFIPILNLMMLFKVKNSYLMNGWYAYYDAMGVDNGGTV